ncbi:MAG: winged helix-turn-helix transcriptional regulator [Chloroflexi bacterium]|nr:winged helix-turn-helix transcriptional regulator [Chloroflexota bacterium]
MRNLVNNFKALSDETRLRILNVLLERECCVCEVMQALDISQTRASRNLNILYDAGFLRLRKVGSWALYSVSKDEMESHAVRLVETLAAAIERNPVARADLERLRKAERVGPGCAERMRSGRKS